MTSLPGTPRTGRFHANDTVLYAEIRGDGPPILFIHGGSEDADDWRVLASRFEGHTVVTYDRRGTGRSGRDEWPGGGTVQHADDAAALLDALGIDRATVFGGSSGALVALRLAITHPDRVARTFAWEPGAITHAPGGETMHRTLRRAVEAHLAAHPDDWVGAREQMWVTWEAVLSPQDETERTPESETLVGSELASEPADDRDLANAEPFVRDDLPILTREHFDEAAVRAAPGEVRFAYGSLTQPIFRDIANELAASRAGRADVVEGATHDAYSYPDAVASYLSDQLGA